MYNMGHAGSSGAIYDKLVSIQQQNSFKKVRSSKRGAIGRMRGQKY